MLLKRFLSRYVFVVHKSAQISVHGISTGRQKRDVISARSLPGPCGMALLRDPIDNSNFKVSQSRAVRGRMMYHMVASVLTCDHRLIIVLCYSSMQLARGKLQTLKIIFAPESSKVWIQLRPRVLRDLSRSIRAIAYHYI
jgi:hypothetical protein